jgi:hypothetical protein
MTDTKRLITEWELLNALTPLERAKKEEKLDQLRTQLVHLQERFVAETAEKTTIQDLGAEQENPAVGSRAWLSKNAKKAANALHDKPGGSREKANRIREIWATGKYATRERCAEEECRALGMSYKTARNALANTPEPNRLDP